MFNNRVLQMSMVKTNKQNTLEAPETRDAWTPERITKTFEDQSKRVAVGFVAVYAAVKVLNTASEIAVNIAPKR